MNKEQLDELVNGIVNIEKDTMRKRFDIQLGNVYGKCIAKWIIKFLLF